jgi:LacI family transcriptional regulator
MVTIRDIAKECGVSPATVSKALNGYGDISEATAERIREMADKMNYMPNSAARILKTNSSHSIGVILEDNTMSGLTHEFFAEILESAKSTLEQHGYDITLISERIGKNSFVEHCLYRKCDGVLVLCVDFTSEQVKELIESGIPLVTIDYPFEGKTCVMSDNMIGAGEIVKYLYRKGHRRIAYIHGEDVEVTRRRLSGFDKACRELGLSIPEVYLQEGRYHDPRSAEVLTEKLMSLPDRPTAIMYPDDYAFLGGRGALENMHLQVPRDVSVVGYDGIHLSQAIRPRLTTWQQNTSDMGRIAAERLMDIVEKKGKYYPENIRVHGRLLEGGSVTAPAR